MNQSIRIIYLSILSFLFVTNYLLASENNKKEKDMCLNEYKECATKILDKVDTFYSNYENKGELCKKNIHTIESSEYDYVICQD